RTTTVTSDRRYRFDLTPAELWAAIAAVEEYPGWWPWLRRFEATGLVAGDSWAATVQPPLPYTLRLTVDLIQVDEPSLVRATVGGDVVGTAQLEIEPDGDGCRARLVSALSPGNRYLQAVAVFARPVVRFGHDWVLDTGARQFQGRVTAAD
ncbi:MAG: SRPBCC family protein, partial [Acidimicrobiales bacterium]